MLYQQPQGGPAQIDWGNQVARALAFYVNAGSGTAPYDAVKGRNLASGSQTRTVGKKGYAYSNSVGNAGSKLSGGTALITSDGVFTGEFSISVYANPSAVGAVQIVYGSMAAASPESYFQFNGALTASSAPGRASFVTPGGTGVEAIGVLDGNYHLFTAVRRANNTLEMWVDGNLAATSSFAGAIATAARVDTFFGYFSGGYGCAFESALVFAHNRAILPAEIRSLSSHPWQMEVDPDEGDEALFFAATATGGAATYSYLAAGGIILSGASPIIRRASKSPFGGVQFSGATTRQQGATKIASGGILIAGSAAQACGKSVAVSGGLILAGAVIAMRGAARTATGGILFSGAAPATATLSFRSAVISAIGGIVISGSSAIVRKCTRITSGGIQFAGTSAVEFFSTLSTGASDILGFIRRRGRR